MLNNLKDDVVYLFITQMLNMVNLNKIYDGLQTIADEHNVSESVVREEAETLINHLKIALDEYKNGGNQ